MDQRRRPPRRSSGNSSRYLPPASDAQIAEIVKRGTAYDVGALTAILAKHIPISQPRAKVLGDALYKGWPDSKIYKLLTARDNARPASAGVGANLWKNRGAMSAGTYHELLTEHAALPEAPEYLDVGAGDGSITRAMARLMGIKTAHCVDVGDFSGDQTDAEVKLEYAVVPAEGGAYHLPYDDGKFDLVTAFQALHHIKDVENMIKELYRVCRPGGLVMVKEHNSMTAYQAMAIDVEHILYMVNEGEFDPRKYYIKLFSRDSLDESMSLFEKVATDYYYTSKLEVQRPDRAFWAIYRKPAQQGTTGVVETAPGPA